jgi:hypothetical protein
VSRNVTREDDKMSHEQLVVVLSTEVEGDRVVVGVFGPYENEEEAGEHVGILRDPEMQKRLTHGQLISTGQYRLRIPRPSRSGWRNCWAGSHRAA